MTIKTDQAFDKQYDAIEKLLEAAKKVQASRDFLNTLPEDGAVEDFADNYLDHNCDAEHALVDAALELADATYVMLDEEEKVAAVSAKVKKPAKVTRGKN
jgi:hypothetical protein